MQDEETVVLAVMPTAVAGQVNPSPIVGLTTEERVTVPAKLLALVRKANTAAPVAPLLKSRVRTLMANSPT